MAKWLCQTFPHAIDHIIGALQRHREAAETGPESIVINWEAGKAARDLARLWSTEQLDEFCAEIAKGGPTRMTEAEKQSLWGRDKAPKSISVPDDPAGAATKLWFWWALRHQSSAAWPTSFAGAPKHPHPSHHDGNPLTQKMRISPSDAATAATPARRATTSEHR